MTDNFSPVGRLVQGSILEANTKNKAGKQLTNRNGEPTQSFFFALAFRKTQAQWWFEPDPMWMAIYNAGRTGYPTFFSADGACLKANFAFKVMDGDGVDDDGKPNNLKPGFAGHWIVKFSSTYASKLLAPGGVYITDPKVPKRGWFYRVLYSVAPNIGSDKPGVYINHNGVELMGGGEEIVGGPDVAQAAAQAPVAALPAGAYALPAGFGGDGTAPSMRPPATGNMAPPPGMGAVAAPPPMVAPPAMGVPGMPPPGGMVPPASQAFVTNAGLPPPPGAVAAPLAPPPMVTQPVYGPGPNAQGFQPAQWMAQGHPADALIAGGQIVRIA